MKKELNVVAALINRDGKILLCQRKVQDDYGLLWEFPGGAVEGFEAFSAAIEREIKEEVGLTIKAEQLIEEFCDEAKDLKIKVFLFSCKVMSGEPQANDCHDFGFFTLPEAGKLNLAPVDKKIYNYLLTTNY